MFTLILAFIFGCAALWCVWQRCFHPLRSYPGPFLNSITSLPNAIAMASGRQHSYVKKLHVHYGSIVRVAPNELSFDDPAAWEDIYNRKDGLPMERHAVLRSSVRNYTGKNASIMQALCHTKDHARHRRALGFPFSNTALLQQQGIIIANVRKFMRHLRKLASQGKTGIEITSWFGHLTMDIIGEHTFGKSFGCLDGKGPTDWSIAMIQVFRSGAYEHAIQYALGIETWPAKFVQWLVSPREPERWRRTHFHNVIQTAKQRMEQGPGDQRDVMHYLLKSHIEGSGLTSREILLNMPVLVLSGSETTAGALSSLMYFMCTRPKTYMRLAAEIRTKFMWEQDINFNSVQPKHLPYLDACIKETLRCVPPQTNPSLREVPPGGARVCGKWIHEGCTVSVSAYTMAQRNFARPTEFRPERWLSRDDIDWDNIFASDRLDASQPFLVGPRQCLGVHLAWLEMRVTMAHLILHFDVALADRERTLEHWTMEDDIRHFKGFKTWLKPDLPLVLTPVLRSPGAD